MTPSKSRNHYGSSKVDSDLGNILYRRFKKIYKYLKYLFTFRKVEFYNSAMSEYQEYLKKASKRRDQIRALALTMPLRKIAAKYGLSVQRVWKIVGKRKAAAT